MGEENRGPSGGSTALLVVGIVAVVLLIPCCGLVALFGTGYFMARTAVREAQTEMMKAQDEARMNFERANQEIQKGNAEIEKAREDIQKDIEGIKIPDLGNIPVPEPQAIPGSPASDDGK